MASVENIIASNNNIQGYDPTDPSTSILVEDFIATRNYTGVQTGAPVGKFFLNSGGSGQCTNILSPPDTNHPGVIRLVDNGEVNGTTLRTHQDMGRALDYRSYFDITTIVSFSALGNADYYIGLYDPYEFFGNSSNNRIGIRSFQTVGDGISLKAWCVKNGTYWGSAVTLLASPSNNVFYKLRMWRSSASEISFSVDNGTPVTISSNIPDTQFDTGFGLGVKRYSFSPTIYLNVDYVSIKINSLVR